MKLLISADIYVFLEAIITNSTDAVAIGLAVASVGGIYSSTATDMGSQVRFKLCRKARPEYHVLQGILDRYRQIQPKFLFLETEVLYGGKKIHLLPKLAEVAKDLSSVGLLHAILFPSRISGQELTLPDMSHRCCLPWITFPPMSMLTGSSA